MHKCTSSNHCDGSRNIYILQACTIEESIHTYRCNSIWNAYLFQGCALIKHIRSDLCNRWRNDKFLEINTITEQPIGKLGNSICNFDRFKRGTIAKSVIINYLYAFSDLNLTKFCAVFKSMFVDLFISLGNLQSNDLIIRIKCFFCNFCTTARKNYTTRFSLVFKHGSLRCFKILGR